MGMFFRHRGFLGGYPGQGPGALGVVMFIVFWAVVALLVVLLVQHYRHDPRHLHHVAPGDAHGPGTAMAAPSSSAAIDILKERFARGDVSEEEYARRLALLKDS